jgi:hypothetical protein
LEWDNLKKKKQERRSMTPEEAVMASWTAEAMCIPQTQKTKSEYRASAMPICGHYLELTGGQEEIVNGQTGFYTAVGTALHEFLQERFPQTKNGGQIWGNWKCRNPKCKHMHMECVNPDSCEKCGTAQPLYSEVELTYRGLISMHIDLMILLPNGNFWLNDWKTCGTFVAENPHLVGLPYSKNVAQVETYCVELWTEKKIRVEHAFLDYTLRGEPETDPQAPKNQVFGLKMTRDRLAARKRQLDRIIAEKQAYEKFKKNRTLENLKSFDDLRPCHTVGDYQDSRYGMRASFKYHMDKECPYANERGCLKRGLSEPAKLLAKRLAGKS